MAKAQQNKVPETSLFTQAFHTKQTSFVDAVRLTRIVHYPVMLVTDLPNVGCWHQLVNDIIPHFTARRDDTADVTASLKLL